MIQFEIFHEYTAIGQAKYLEKSNDWMLRLDKKQMRHEILLFFMKERKNFASDFMYNTQIEQHDGSAVTVIEKVKSTAKQTSGRRKQKPQHGKCVTPSKKRCCKSKSLS